MKVEIEEAILLQLAYEHVELATSEAKQKIYEALIDWIEDQDNLILSDKLEFLIKQQEEQKDALYKRYGITRQRKGNINEEHS